MLTFISLFAYRGICANAQTTNKEIIALHPKISLLYNGLSSANSNFKGANPDCDTLPSGYGIGGALGIFVERRLSDRTFAGLGVSYVNRSGKLNKNNIYPMRDTISGAVENVNIEDAIDLKTSFLEFQPEFRFTIADNFLSGPLRIGLGARLALPLAPTFEQSREVVSPEDFYLESGGAKTKKLLIASGDITTKSSMLYGLTVGLENMLKVGANSFLTEQLSFDYNFNSLTEDADIKHFAVKLDFGLRFGFIESEKAPELPPAPKPAPKPETKPEPVVLEPALAVEDLKFEGKIKTGEEILASLPIVNSIFFEPNSSTLPGKYILSAPMQRNWFAGDPVESHKEVLVRIAQILSQNPTAQVVLEGATAGPALEPEGIALAQKRAESVRDAFIAIGVPADKISIKALSKPTNPSNQEFAEGVEENRRVDIVLKSAPLQEYVAFSQFSILSGKLEAALKIENVGDKAKIKISTNATERPLGFQERLSIPVERRLQMDETAAQFYLSMEYEGARARKETTVDLAALPQENIERNLNNFNAILRFSYDSSVLTDDNKRLLDQLAKLLPGGSTIKILGSADALGTQERNAELSRERAQATENYIKSVAGDKFKFETGVNSSKFDESVPEGRFLSRSIGIRVK